MHRMSSLAKELNEGFPDDEPVGGYEYEFVDAVDEEFKCCICLEVMRDPYQIVPCGHCCCRSCLGKLLRSFGEKSSCPIDRQSFDVKTIFPDNNCKRKIRNLHILCEKSNSGCVWQGELSRYQAHTADCPYIEIQCSHEGCRATFLRIDKEEHEISCPWQLIQCNMCQDTIRAFELKEHKRSKCPNENVPCTFGCSLEIRRAQIDEHVKSHCPKVSIDCFWKPLGCTVMGPREDIEQHLTRDQAAHHKLLFSELENLKSKQLEILRNEEVILKRLESGLGQSPLSSKQDLYFTWPLPSFSQVPQLGEVRSAIFSTGSRGYCFCLALFKRPQDTVISVRLVPGIYDHFLRWPFKCNFSVFLLDQGTSGDRLHIQKAVDFADLGPHVPQCYQQPNDETTIPLFPLLTVLNDTLQSDRYAAKDQVFIMIKIQPYNFEENLGL